MGCERESDRARERRVAAREPAAPEAPETGERAVAGPAKIGVALERGGERIGACSRAGNRADFAVNLDIEGVLQHADGRADAHVDGDIEVKEGEGCGKLGAVRRSPITLAINVGDERVGNDAQIGDESGAVGRGDLDAVLAREGGESDASVGGTAGIEGIVAPATLEGEHHGEGRSEAVLVVDCGTDAKFRC